MSVGSFSSLALEVKSAGGALAFCYVLAGTEHVTCTM
jgi:hypothetical protein